MTRTFCAAIEVDAATDAALSAYAQLFSRVERTLHADLERVAAGGGKPRSADFKNGYLPRFGINARQFNSARASLDGRRASIKKLAQAELQKLQGRARKRRQQRATLLKKLSKVADRTQCQRMRARAAQLRDLAERAQAEADRLKARLKAGRIRLCFGSNTLFRAQHHLEANGFASHAEWKAKWDAARSSQFFCVGSKGEPGGNLNCTAKFAGEDALTLRVRLPDVLVPQDAPGGKHLWLTGIRFAYGWEDVRATLERGAAMSWRFIRERPGRWQLRLSVDVLRPEPAIASPAAGCIGVDVNAGFLLAVETDAYGNRLAARRLVTPSRGFTRHQRAAGLGEAVKALMAWAKAVGKPVVLEDLDLEKKKSGRSAATNRKVSATAYAKVAELIRARAADKGIAVREVDPAWSSVQGQLRAVPYGLSVHGGAAWVLARRSQGLRESLPKKGGPVRLALRGDILSWWVPARKPAAGGDDAWRAVGDAISQTLAAYRRLKRASRQRGTSRAGTTSVFGEIPELEGW